MNAKVCTIENNPNLDSFFCIIKSSKIDFIFLPALNLIMWQMTSTKTFEKLAISSSNKMFLIIDKSSWMACKLKKNVWRLKSNFKIFSQDLKFVFEGLIISKTMNKICMPKLCYKKYLMTKLKPGISSHSKPRTMDRTGLLKWFVLQHSVIKTKLLRSLVQGFE